MTHEPPTAPTSVPPAVSEEEHILQRALATIKAHHKPSWREDYHSELLKLRDNLNEARLVEDRASILEQMTHIANLARQQQRAFTPPLETSSPYFGHMRLDGDDGRVRDILIGKGTFIRGETRIVDWRHAPISKIFYQCRQGDDYVMEVDGHETEGEVTLRRTLLIRDSQLQRVASDDTTWVRDDSGGWRPLSDTHRLAGGQGTAVQPAPIKPGDGRATRADKHLPDIAALLDAPQYALITQPDAGLIAIQGSAGSGKTTVALHRVAYLAYLNPQRFVPERTLIVVYSRALAAYISKVLPALGVFGVKVTPFEDWTARLRQRLFPSLPQRVSDETPSVVSRFKQHAGVLAMLEEAVEHFSGRSPLAIWTECFTSLNWIQTQAARHAPGAFSDTQLRSIHQWCVRQHTIRAEGSGPNMDDLPSIDAEDDALLLRLHQLAKGPLPNARKRPLNYTHLVIDEVQDLAPIDIALLLGTVKKDHPVTLAGDTAQKIVAGNDFQDWAYVLNSLGLPHVQLSPLRISYRSTAPIMRVAHAILGPLAPEQPPVATRGGPNLALFDFPSLGELCTFLTDHLHQLMLNEPQASVALLSRSSGRANAVWRALDRAAIPRLHRVRNQDFTFAPGVEITEIAQTKGLEFDYVILLDGDARTWPVTDASRRLLHVAITRAAHMCWLLTDGPPSPLLPLDLIDQPGSASDPT